MAIDKIPSVALDSGVPTRAQLPAGSVLQVVQTQKTDTFALTGTTAFTDITGLSVTITPTAATNKILIFYAVQVGTDGYCDLRLVRDSTNIAQGDAYLTQTRSTTHSGPEAATSQLHHSMCWLDSPATTSATTYKLQLGTPYNASYNAYINRAANNDNATYNARTVSTITAMEIAA
jgi:hypothetical protein